MSATTPIDQYNGDPTLTHLLAALEDAPRALAAVKTASFDKAAAASLPDSAFAWEDARRFPVHTREDTIASVAYRLKYAAHVPRHVDEKLSEAVDAYGIPPDLFVSARPATKVAAAAEPVYALPDLKRLPLGSAEQVKVAEEVLHRDGHVLPFEEKVRAFTKVAQAAEQHKVALDAATAPYVADSACNVRMLRDRIGMRAATTKVAAAVSAYDTLDEALKTAGEVIYDRAQLVRLAAKLHELDKVAGLTSEYGRRIFDPMKTVFNDAHFKVASDIVDLAGKQVPVDTLMQLPQGVWDQLDAPEMGKLAASGDATTFKQAFVTLPLDIKVVLAGQLR